MSNAGKVWDIREAYKKQRGNQWDAGNGSKALVGGGYTPSNTNKIETFNIAVAGNATDFGDLTGTVGEAQAGASPTRAFWARGGSSEQVNFEAGGNTASFISLGITPRTNGAAGDSTRSMFMGNGAPAFANTVEFITTAGNGFQADFGNLSTGTDRGGALSSPTRTLFAGGEKSDGNNTNTIDFFTTATTGNATDFGDLTVANRYLGGAGSTTRGLFFNQYSTTRLKSIDVVQISSTGNATDFGDMITAIASGGTTSSKTRAVRCGGSTPTLLNTMEFVTIATAGNATDFGDMTEAKNGTNACSNGHGGLDLGVLPRPSVMYMPGSGRGFVHGGTPGPIAVIQKIEISTAGAASDFGDLTQSVRDVSGCGTITRIFSFGGAAPAAPSMSNVIGSYSPLSEGNESDYGDLSVARGNNAGTANRTRGLSAGGVDPGMSDVIDYFSTTSAGNATDFGNLTVARWGVGGSASPTRALFSGGFINPGSYSNVIDYVTISSTGDATDFGDLTTSPYPSNATASSDTRSLTLGGGNSSPGFSNVIDYVTIASTGNATDFGDLTIIKAKAVGLSTNVRALCATGQTPSTNPTAEIDFVTIVTTGNATDFGDAIRATKYGGGGSDNHGGLQE